MKSCCSHASNTNSLRLSVLLFCVICFFLPSVSVAQSDLIQSVSIGLADYNGQAGLPDFLDVLKRTASSSNAAHVNSIQTTLTWSSLQPESGDIDWTPLTAVRRAVQESGNTWIPLLALDSDVEFPSWVLADSPSSPGKSRLNPWTPSLNRNLRKLVRSLAEYLRSERGVEAVVLSADYFGPETFAGAAAQIRSDNEAAESFRSFLRRRHGKAIGLNDKWGTRYFTWSEVFPFAFSDRPNDEAWREQFEWLCQSRTESVDSLLRDLESSRVPVYLRLTPGSDDGSIHYPELLRAVADRIAGVQVRITPTNYPAMHARVSLITNTCRHLGLKLILESPEDAEVTRIPDWTYLMATSGAAGVRFGTPPPHGLFENRGGMSSLFTSTPPDTRVAVYRSNNKYIVPGASANTAMDAFRDTVQFDIVNDDLVRTGILDDYEMLVFLDGSVINSDAYRKVYGFVRSGGVLVYPESVGQLSDPQGDDDLHKALFESLMVRAAKLPTLNTPLTRDDASSLLNLASHPLKDGLVVYIPEHCGGNEVLNDFVRICISGEIRLPQIRPALDTGDAQLHLFTNVFVDGSILYLNASDKPLAVVANLTGTARRVEVPAHEIVEVQP